MITTMAGNGAADASEAEMRAGHGHCLVCYYSKLHLRRADALCRHDNICKYVKLPI